MSLPKSLKSGISASFKDCQIFQKLRKVVGVRSKALRYGHGITKVNKMRPGKRLSISEGAGFAYDSGFASDSGSYASNLITSENFARQNDLSPQPIECAPRSAVNLNLDLAVNAIKFVIQEEFSLQIKKLNIESQKQIENLREANKKEITSVWLSMKKELLDSTKNELHLFKENIYKEKEFIKKKLFEQFQNEIKSILTSGIINLSDNLRSIKKEVDLHVQETQKNFQGMKGKIIDLETQVNEKIKDIEANLIERANKVVELENTLIEVKDISQQNIILMNSISNTFSSKMEEVVKNLNKINVLGTGLNPLATVFQDTLTRQNKKTGSGGSSKKHDIKEREKDTDYSSSESGSSLSSHDSDCSHKTRCSVRKHVRSNRHSSKMMTNEKPVFDGDNKSAPDFIEEVDNYKKRFELSSRDLLLMFPTFLSGRAREWWEIIKRKVTYWHQLKNKIYSHFLDEFELEKIRRKWYKLKFNEGDDIEIFTMEALKLRRLLNPKEKMKQKCERIILKLPSHFRDYLFCRRTHDEEHLLQNIKEVMRLKGEDNSKDNTKQYYNQNTLNKFNKIPADSNLLNNSFQANRVQNGTRYIRQQGMSHYHPPKINSSSQGKTPSHPNNAGIAGQPRPRKISYIWFRGRRFKNIELLQRYFDRRSSDGMSGSVVSNLPQNSLPPSSPTSGQRH